METKLKKKNPGSTRLGGHVPDPVNHKNNP